MRTVITCIVAGVLLAGCGLGSPAATRPSPSVSALQVYRQFAQCVRQHGHPDFPDPSVDSQGNMSPPPAWVALSKDDPAIATCGSILGRLPGNNRTAPPDLVTLRLLAKCMRDHDITDWPDPAPDGSFPLSTTQYGRRWSYSPMAQQLLSVMNGPCKQYVPDGGFHVS
jgi:hypothetical protein